MQLAFSGDISGMCFFGRVIHSKVDRFAFGLYARLVPLAVFPYAFYPKGVVFSCIGLVFTVITVRNIAQISNSVIGFNAVDMVDFIRPDAKHVKPCKAVLFVRYAINANAFISLIVSGISGTSFLSCTRSADKPSKNARIRVVMEKLFKPFLSKHLTPLISRLIESTARLIRPFSGCIPSRTDILTNLGVI
jgi:hypothetical protein